MNLDKINLGNMMQGKSFQNQLPVFKQNDTSGAPKFRHKFPDSLWIFETQNLLAI